MDIDGLILAGDRHVEELASGPELLEAGDTVGSELTLLEKTDPRALTRDHFLTTTELCCHQETDTDHRE